MIHDLADQAIGTTLQTSVVLPAQPTSWLAILNPNAGHPLSRRALQVLVDRFEGELGAQVIITKDSDQAAALVDSSDPGTALAVFGGDGTIAEVVNHMDLEHQQLLPLKGGTGNGLANDLGLTSIGKALEAARVKRAYPIDIMRISFRTGGKEVNRLAISTASLGYATETVVLAKQLARSFGTMRYTLASIGRALHISTFSVQVRLDGHGWEAMSLSNVMVNNTRHAGNFPVFRTASLQDTHLNALLARATFGSQILHNLAVLSKTYVYSTGMEVSARTLSLYLEAPLQLMIDGELWDQVTEVQFEFHPRKLMCFAAKADPQ